MGLFDTFVTKRELRCPKCGDKLPPYWQTKSLAQMMYCFEEGDKFDYFTGLEISQGKIPVYTLCRGCGEFVAAHAVIEDGYFVRIEIVTELPEEIKNRWGS